MRIGYLQYAPLLGQYDQNIALLSDLLEQNLSSERADLLVLPELCNSGYNFSSAEIAGRSAENVNHSRFIDALTEICARHNLHIVSGFNEQEGDRLYNAALLIGPGGYVGRYRKLHLFLNEKDFFQPGDAGLPVFDIGSCKLGILVCFDWVFPEVWRVLAMAGADVICHPSNLVLPGFCQKAIPVHALVNRIYIVTANRIGTEGNLTFTGMSTIADPNGDVLAQAGQTEEHFMTCNVDIALARNKLITPRNHLFDDRRVAEYAAICAP